MIDHLKIIYTYCQNVLEKLHQNSNERFRIYSTLIM